MSIYLLPTPSSGSMFIVDQIMQYSDGHRIGGIFIAFGPDTKIAAGRIAGVKIIDMAPTSLHLMGLPVPGRYWTRRVLEEIMEANSPRRLRLRRLRL